VVEYDIEGKPLRITGTTADVTERMRAEREFRKSEEKYRHLIETAYDVVYTMDLNGHVTFVNPACLQHIGYYPEEITGKNYLDFIPEEYKNQIRRFYCSQVEKKLPNTSYEFPIIAKNGKMRWFVQNTQLLMKEGTVVGFQAIARDITDRKQMEEALRQSEKRYRDLTEFLPQAVFEVDATMRPTFVNSACVELTGYSSEELLSGVNPLMLIISEDRARMAEDFQKVMQGQTILMTEYTGLRKDGPTVPVLGSAAPIYENERIVGIRGVISDISALRQAEKEKMALQNQLFLSQKMEALGTLVGGIAHDFNNMLQIIIGYCEMILAEKKVDQPHFYRHLQTIIKTGKGGAELVQKLLAFGQQTQTVPVPLDLNHHISQLSALMSRTLPHVVKLTLDLTDKPTTILASHGMLDQVVMNLAINASEAMPKGGGLNISTTIVTLDGQNHKSRLEPRPGKYVRLTVKDSGQGMDEQTLLRIFDPFFSTKERGATGGTGLGLSVVSGIVQQLGGHITCRSKLGEGTEFKVLLPVIEDSDEIPESVDPVTPVEGKGTILVVEDILEVVELEKMGLESAGYRVMVATSGKEALEIYGLRNKEISLVILDLIMPEMPGRDCLMELIKIDPTVKVLIASGYSPEDDLLREINPLVRGFIHKPFSMTGLQDKVRFALDDIN
ncbi:MAG: PAS domain-containing hybrid sensor histidine kinase/response regulator, partial [Desulfomonilaceae bacterium]